MKALESQAILFSKDRMCTELRNNVDIVINDSDLLIVNNLKSLKKLLKKHI